MTPYLAYWIPEHLGGSGVLATVACGLYVSWNGPRLIPAATRLQGIFFWDLIIYLIEGFVFLITGLQARTLIEKAHDFPVNELLVATAMTAAIVIVARFVWIFPATYLPRWLIPPLARRDPSPPWQQVFVLGFTGVRGVVSLAAALAIPLTIESGAPFPHRDMILFATFGVIIITLVGQGLMLPTVIRWLGVAVTARPSIGASRRPSWPPATRRSTIRGSISRSWPKDAASSAETVEFLNARHDHRERLIPTTSTTGSMPSTRATTCGWN